MIADMTAGIIAEAGAALDGLEVTVTDQPHEAVSAIVAGAPAVIVLPPEIEWQTATRRTATWTLWTLTPTTDPTDATAMFEPILDDLAPALLPDRARPETYEIGDRTFPGYTLTFTTEHP